MFDLTLRRERRLVPKHPEQPTHRRSTFSCVMRALKRDCSGGRGGEATSKGGGIVGVKEGGSLARAAG
jgi:hypothetical protein